MQLVDKEINNKANGNKFEANAHYLKAKKYYDIAYSEAQKLSHHAVILEAILAQTRWLIHEAEYNTDPTKSIEAVNFLKEKAFNDEKSSQTKAYRIYMIDLMIAKAKAFLLQGDKRNTSQIADEIREATTNLHRENEIEDGNVVISHYWGIDEVKKTTELCKR